MLDKSFENCIKQGKQDYLKETDEHTLIFGHPGIALICDAMAPFTLESGILQQRAFSHLQTSIAAMSKLAMTPWLYDGFSGIAWLLELFRKSGNYNEIEGDPNKYIDLLLADYIDKVKEERRYELISGLTGIGVYFLERPMSAATRLGLKKIVTNLEIMAEKDTAGIRWRFPSGVLSLEEQKLFPGWHYNLGLAHGIPGVIAFLARVYEAGIERKLSLSLIRSAVSWLLQQKFKTPQVSLFPRICSMNNVGTPTRVSWCYGIYVLQFQCCCCKKNKR